MNGQYGISVATTRGTGGSTGSGKISKTIEFDDSTGNILLTDILREGDIITTFSVFKIGDDWTPDTNVPTFNFTLENVGTLAADETGVADLNAAGYDVYQVYGVVQHTGDSLSFTITGVIATGTAKVIVEFNRP